MIEHITFAEGLNMLSECYRILKPGGKIRLSTPNLSFLIELHQPDKSTLQKDYIKWATDLHVKKWVKDAFVRETITYDSTFVINTFFRRWGHQFIYDKKLLCSVLEKVGFIKITRCALNESEDEELRGLANESRMPDGFLNLETITVEGTKPIDS
jgi:predicted SAM-dependent methyltransferase